MALLLQLLSAGLLLAGIWHVMQDRVESASRELSVQLRDDLLAGYRERGNAGLQQLIRSRLSRDEAEELAILLVSQNGTVLAGNLSAWPPILLPDGSWQTASLFRRNRDQPELVGLVGTRLDDGAMLLTGHVIEDERQLIGLLAEVLTVAMLLAAFLAAAGAAITVRLVSKRLQALQQTSAAVAKGALSRRVPESGGQDAFDRLGDDINSMLDQLERVVTELQVVTDGMAHDLRSPLTRLAANLEGAAAATNDPTVLGEIDKAGGEIRHLLKIVTTALEIGRVEAGIGRDRLEPVDLADLLRDLAEVYGPVAEDKGFDIRLAIEAPVVLASNRQLLSQALGNLVDNALTYADPATLTLSLRRHDGRVLLGVADEGPGIPAENRERATQRFARLDPARHQAGAGLGLTLVAAVARLHGGAMRLEEQGRGLQVVLDLPASFPAR